ncbi:MAG: hypothetical protein MO846_05950 [Candidatus Devosia symbiotica]|nr:hypothetical protein [Candidatus Devosia symbiotica]
MSNVLSVNPAIIINRIVAREGTPLAAHLGKVAELRMRLENAENEQQERATLTNPDAKVQLILTGADVMPSSG